MRFPPPPKIGLIRKSHFTFVIQTTLVFILGALLWYASHLETIQQLRNRYDYVPSAIYFNLIWLPFLIYSAVGLVLFVMIYLGTSYDVTPFRMIMPFPRLIKNIGAVSVQESPTLPDTTVTSVKTTTPLTRVTTTSAGERVASPDQETVDMILAEAAQSAEQLANKMENRINLHLTFGVLTGGVGLVVWYMTFYRPGLSQSSDHTISGRAFDTLPRITILIFVELLAGFFLRQYRIGVEDLKYFLELKRRADAKRIAYTIIERTNKAEAKLDFAKLLLKEKSDTILSKGEMTTTLYAIDKEKNEFIKGIDSLTAKLSDVSKELKQAKSVKPTNHSSEPHASES